MPVEDKATTWNVSPPVWISLSLFFRLEQINNSKRLALCSVAFTLAVVVVQESFNIHTDSPSSRKLNSVTLTHGPTGHCGHFGNE